MVALPALPDFEIGHTLFINLSRQQELPGVVPQQRSVSELDHGKPNIEKLKGCFLALALKDMADHKDRLPLPFGS